MMATTKSSSKDSVESQVAMTANRACLLCRSRHLKCDGQPTCSRCADSNQSCLYVQSRRGHRPSRKRRRSLPTEDVLIPRHDDPSALLVGDEPYRGQPPETLPKPIMGGDDLLQAPTGHLFPNRSGVSVATDESSRLRELYYTYFHGAHPVMVPLSYLPHLQMSAPPSVDAAISYVGSQYSAKARANPLYLQKLQSCLSSRDAKPDGYTVLCLLLLGVVARAHDQNDHASEAFNRAIDIALEIGMHRADFAEVHGGGSAFLQEMWRRVWWELYVNELLLAAMRHDSYSRVIAVQADAGLPCEENAYGDCQPKRFNSLNDYDQFTFFDDDELSFSSFAYRIVAARTIGQLLKLNQPFCPDSLEVVTTIDIALNNWYLHLPEHKKSPIGQDGKLDEMLFQAHLMTNAATICLHRPRSELVFTAVQDSTSCTPTRSYGLPAEKFSVHTAKCVKAADRITDLITLPSDTLQHTPLFTCMLTLSAVVHLSGYLLSQNLKQREGIRERLALSVGSLKAVKSTWMLANSVLLTIKAAAREVMACGSQTAAPTPTMNDVYDQKSAELNPWAITVSDPLFTEVPDLLPTD